MRQLSAEKYNIAWFKLAEFVMRGEKERALTMYRLLMHSVNNKALALQLEGDLLVAFCDEAAKEKYRGAASYYLNDNKLVEAFAAYQQLRNFSSCSVEDLHTLVHLSCQLSYSDYLALYLQELTLLLLDQNLWEKCFSLIQTYFSHLSAGHSASICYRLIEKGFTLKKSPEIMQEHLLDALKTLSHLESKGSIQLFLTMLETSYPSWHETALILLNNANSI